MTIHRSADRGSADLGAWNGPSASLCVQNVSRRAQAIRDGVLIDVSAQAAELGCPLPTAVTAGVWAECVALPPGVEGAGQSEAGRLRAVLLLAKLALQAALGRRDHAFFDVEVLSADGAHGVKHLWVHIGPGDEGEAVLTVNEGGGLTMTARIRPRLLRRTSLRS